jgi:hypothetical protein
LVLLDVDPVLVGPLVPVLVPLERTVELLPEEEGKRLLAVGREA